MAGEPTPEPAFEAVTDEDRPRMAKWYPHSKAWSGEEIEMAKASEHV